MTTTSDKAHRIFHMTRELDEENPGALGRILDAYHDVITHMGSYVDVSRNREKYPRLVELERELSILLGEPEPPMRAPAPWEIDEFEKRLPVLFRGGNQGRFLVPCNIRNCDTMRPDYFEVQRVERARGTNGFEVIARDHLGEDVRFKIKVERS